MNQKINIPILLGLALCIGLLLLVYLVRISTVKSGSTLAKIISRLVGGILFIGLIIYYYYYYYYLKTPEPIPDPTPEPTAEPTAEPTQEPKFRDFPGYVNYQEYPQLYDQIYGLFKKSDLLERQTYLLTLRSDIANLITFDVVNAVFIPGPITEPTPKINIPTNIFTRLNTQDLQTCPKVDSGQMAIISVDDTIGLVPERDGRTLKIHQEYTPLFYEYILWIIDEKMFLHEGNTLKFTPKFPCQHSEAEKCIIIGPF